MPSDEQLIPLLNDHWRDIFSIVGVIGTVLTLIGLMVSIIQIRRTRRASEEATSAANQTRDTIRSQLSRYTAATLLRQLTEAQNAFSRQDWKLVVVRLGDLAEQVAQILAHSDRLGGDWTIAASKLRKWQQAARGFETGTATCSPDQVKKWDKSMGEFASQLDRLNLPL